MSTTFTKQQFPMSIMPFVTEDIDAIKQGQLILFHTETLWCIGCDSHNPVAIERLSALATTTNPVELVVDSIDMISNYTSHLHPRIQTLLMLHKRPLTVLYPPNKQLLNQHLFYSSEEIAIRLSLNTRTKEMIGLLKRPIACIYATKNSTFPQSFGEISSDIFTDIDHVSQYGRNIKQQGAPSVFVKLGYKDELDFLRG